MASTTITCADGFELGAYEASPAGEAKGAVVVIQEIFGVNSHIRSVVDGYAEAGFYAIAPAIFDRLERDIQLGYTEDDMNTGIELAFQKLDMNQTLADLQATIDAAAERGHGGVLRAGRREPRRPVSGQLRVLGEAGHLPGRGRRGSSLRVYSTGTPRVWMR